MKFDLVIALQTQENLTSWEVGERLLSAVFSEPKLAPQRIATFSEVSKSNGCDVGGLADCREHWAIGAIMRVNGGQSEFAQDFHWVRNKVTKAQGVITFASPTTPRKPRQFSSINL